MRGMYTEAILMAIAERPGIRAVEIADKVDCEIEAVERSIKEEIDAGNVRREIITAPNGKPTCAFWMKGVSSVPGAPAVPAVVQQVTPPAPKVDAPAAPAPQPAVVAAPPPASVVEVEPAPAPTAKPTPAPLASATRTKVEILMDYLREKPDQTATDDEFRKVIGLRKDQHPSTFLSTQRRNGQIHKDIDVWRLGPRKTVANTPAPDVPVIDAGAEFRCALWSDGELQLARGAQIAMRLSAAEVGRLRSYLAGGSAP